MNTKIYLGDGVHAEMERGMIKLTTDEGEGTTNTIYLEAEVYSLLTMWVKRIEDAFSNKGEEEEPGSSDGYTSQDAGAPGNEVY